MEPVYEAWELPRGNVVVLITDNDRAHAEVVSDCHPTINDAQLAADQRNLGVWLALKPGDSPADNWDEDVETAALLDILDRMLIPEEKLDLLEHSLSGMAA